jgi:hypothetical protein
MSISITLPLSSFYEFLDETALASLEQQTVSAFPDTHRRQHVVNTIQVPSVEMIPAQESLMVKATTRNTKTSSSNNPTIEFLNVEFVQENDNQTVTFTGSDGEEYNIKPLSITQTDVKVTCTCMDFYWRFAIWNHTDGSLLGPKPDPYVRKTEDRAPANPSQTPGMCKHILRLVDHLQQERILR